MEKLYFNQDGIKGSGVAQVCKFFRSKHINVAPLLPELRPIQPRTNNTWLHRTVNSGPQEYIASRVEDANLIAVGDSAWASVVDIHFE